MLVEPFPEVNAQDAAIARSHRDRFRASDTRETAPRAAVAAWTICADTDEEVRA